LAWSIFEMDTCGQCNNFFCDACTNQITWRTILWVKHGTIKQAITIAKLIKTMCGDTFDEWFATGNVSTITLKLEFDSKSETNFFFFVSEAWMQKKSGEFTGVLELSEFNNHVDDDFSPAVYWCHGTWFKTKKKKVVSMIF
jgi:hypothetical protein